MNLTTWLDSFQAWYSSLSTTQSSSLHLVVAAAGVWLLLKGLGYCVTVVRLAKLRLPAPGLRVVDAGEIPAEERALLDAYGAILNALGFRPAFSAVFDALQRYSDYWLHIDSLSTASVQRASNPQDGPLAQVVFVSLTSDGVSHITTNRLSYASISTPDRFIVHDAMASSLAAHWRAHAARLTARADWKILDREKIEITALTAGAQWNAAANAIGATIDFGDGTRRLAWRFIPGYAWRLIQGAAKNARLPYVLDESRPELGAGPVKTANHSAAALIEQAILLQKPPRRALSTFLLLMLFIAGGISMALWLELPLSISAVPAFIGLLLFHDLGHWVAMRFYGYHNNTIYFFPFFDSLATSEKEDATPIQHTLVLLAGPVPGLMLGLLLLAACYGPLQNSEWLSIFQNIAWMAISLNVFNLLPIPPLDGGRIAEIFVYGRLPWLRFGGVVMGAAFFVWLASTQGTIIIWMLALVIAILFLPAHWRLARLLGALRKNAVPANDATGASTAQNTKRQVAIRHLAALMSYPPMTRWTINKKIMAIQWALPVALTSSPGWRSTFAGLSLYCAALLLPVAALASWAARSDSQTVIETIAGIFVPEMREFNPVKQAAAFSKRLAAASTPDEKIDLLIDIRHSWWDPVAKNTSYEMHVAQAEEIALTLPPGNPQRGVALIARATHEYKSESRFRTRIDPVINEFSAAGAPQSVLKQALIVRGTRHKASPVEERIADLTRAQSIKAELPMALRHTTEDFATRALALAYAESAQFTEAERVLREALDGYEPLLPGVDLAWVLIAQNKPAEAATELKSALQVWRNKAHGKTAELAWVEVDPHLFALRAWLAVLENDRSRVSALRKDFNDRLTRGEGEWNDDSDRGLVSVIFRTLFKKKAEHDDAAHRTQIRSNLLALLEDAAMANISGDTTGWDAAAAKLRAVKGDELNALRQVHRALQSDNGYRDSFAAPRASVLLKILCGTVPDACTEPVGSCKAPKSAA